MYAPHIAVLIFLGILFFISVVLALLWSVKSDHFSNLEETAKSIFNDEEPEGSQTDFFPNHSKNK